jgi:hypothetical protein
MCWFLFLYFLLFLVYVVPAVVFMFVATFVLSICIFISSNMSYVCLSLLTKQKKGFACTTLVSLPYPSWWVNTCFLRILTLVSLSFHYLKQTCFKQFRNVYIENKAFWIVIQNKLRSNLGVFLDFWGTGSNMKDLKSNFH